MKTAKLGILVACLICAGTILAYYSSPENLPAWAPLNLTQELDHMTAGEYSTVVDKDGRLVTKLARHVYKGDEIIRGNGEQYRIVSVKGNLAKAEMVGIDRDLLAYMEYFDRYALPAQAQTNRSRAIGIYHTHSDESYVPTDGTESKPGNGGIFRVGTALASSLRDQGVRADHSFATHEPHDAQSYVRSRKTVVELMKRNPAALIDVHRDGVPDASFYRRTVNGRQISQLRLVIGSQNPNMNANKDFARRLMAFANKTHPNLVKEVFIGRGNYNQDLMPTAILVEAGTHTVSRQEAEDGITLLADAIPTVLGVSPGVTPRAGTSPGVWTALLWILAITVVGAGVFLVVSAGGVKQAQEKLGQFFSKEIGLKLNNRKEGGEGER
ncbi:stage II sporulation protein P [Desulforudis sp. 1088]|uniref:stage II sporulation protein P n=1 Tax=unclassified Candidatus Desulforudis TaxID=2635950 RepID=UPI00347E0F2A